MRYAHQAFEVEVPLDPAWVETNDVAALLQAFHLRHAHLYGHADWDETVALISLHVHATGIAPKSQPSRIEAATAPTLAARTRRIRLHHTVVQVPVYERNRLLAGDAFMGPALVDQDDATVLVLDGFSARQDEYGNLVLESGAMHFNDRSLEAAHASHTDR
jgi:N-methylhydantoinase A